MSSEEHAMGRLSVRGPEDSGNPGVVTISIGNEEHAVEALLTSDDAMTVAHVLVTQAINLNGGLLK